MNRNHSVVVLLTREIVIVNDGDVAPGGKLVGGKSLAEGELIEMTREESLPLIANRHARIATPEEVAARGGRIAYRSRGMKH